MTEGVNRQMFMILTSLFIVLLYLKIGIGLPRSESSLRWLKPISAST